MSAKDKKRFVASAGSENSSSFSWIPFKSNLDTAYLPSSSLYTIHPLSLSTLRSVVEVMMSKTDFCKSLIVHKEGVEPSRSYPPDPKSGASTIPPLVHGVPGRIRTGTLLKHRGLSSACLPFHHRDKKCW